ncbi:MAG: tRNA (adenosine(37)-N6)-threonylcarbamoyltransferase complex ATPase subunit type 1 TsaE [Patescibacteria group bacterium]|jgi:tRNA threonylcarbamoyladenosine biosynthesis protein TsaE
MKIIVKNEKETISEGIKFSSLLTGGMILCLHGELGSGKTTFTKGLAKGLGINIEIKSPTFTLMNIYKISNKKIKTLIHIDTYRLKNEHELIEIGAEDYLGNPDTITIIEWPEKIKTLLIKKNVADIYFSHTANGFREITFN